MARKEMMGAEVICVVNEDVTIEGTVKWVPSATGDSWHIMNKWGVLFLVNQFQYMQLLYTAETRRMTEEAEAADA